MKTKYKLITACLPLAFAATSNEASAATTVAWHPPAAVTDYTVIYDAQADGGSQPGKSVYQLNFINYTFVGSGTTISSWPVLDQRTVPDPDDNDFLVGSFDGGAAHNNFIDASPSGWDTTGMTTIMDGGRFDFTTFTLSNLTVAQTYLVQFLVADNRSYIGPVNRSETITAGGNTSGALTFGIDAPNFASSLIGTFVADAGSIDFTFNGSNTQVNAVFVTAIPEPSGALLGGLGMLALLRRRR